MEKRKRVDLLHDAQTFNEIFCDETMCKTLLETLLGAEITMMSAPEICTVLDEEVLTVDMIMDMHSVKSYINLIPAFEKDFKRKTRIYDALLEKDLFLTNQLKHPMPIFICGYDPYENNRVRHFFMKCCVEVPELEFPCGSRLMVFNTQGTIVNVSEEAKAFLQYLETGRTDIETDLIQKTKEKLKCIRHEY